MNSILVTAVGGDLGQAIVKALRVAPHAVTVHGCDGDAEGIGGAFVDEFHVVPKAGDPGYLEAITALAQRVGATAIIPASEPEIRVLSHYAAPGSLPGLSIVCQERSWIEIHGDKLRSMQALEGKVDLAAFADGEDAAAVDDLVRRAGFPLVVKPRQSSGSRLRQIVNDEEALRTAVARTPLPLVQTYLDDSGGEYSIGVFACSAFRTAIAFRRDLGAVGCSWYAETSNDADVLQYAMDVAAASGLIGSGNVQVRKTRAGVRLLEINPRFSSLVAARALCGFHDVDWSLSLASGTTPDAPPPDYRPLRFRRFFHEVIDVGRGYEAVKEWEPAANTVLSRQQE